MTYQAEDKTRVKRVRTEQAIQFAMSSRWDDAIAANKSIIAVFPEEADAYNRLGKALSEIGKIKEAREAYTRALEIEPNNMIARKNLDRLASARAKTEPDKAQQVDTSLFIEEMGKTGVTTLKPANLKTLTTLSAGDEVALKGIGTRLTVETMAGEYLSDIEPKLALRLSRLINGGNKYAAAVAGVAGDSIRVIIKETFQHPTQVGKLSFPAGKAGDVVRPYTKESLVRADMDDDDDFSDESDEWEDIPDDVEPDAEPREVNLFDAAREEEPDEVEFEE
jgi:Tfp pilus assembly protein PilF